MNAIAQREATIQCEVDHAAEVADPQPPTVSPAVLASAFSVFAATSPLAVNALVPSNSAMSHATAQPPVRSILDRYATQHQLSNVRGFYKLEPLITPPPSRRDLDYLDDDYYIEQNVERPTQAGQDKGVYSPEVQVVLHTQVDQSTQQYKAWALDRRMGKAWTKGQDQFVLAENDDYNPMRDTLSDLSKHLRVAREENFPKMCQSIIWGAEAADPDVTREFYTMLQGLVENFKPENRYHLDALVTVADYSWKIARTRRTQKNLFENGHEGYNELGVPIKTVNAESRDEQLSVLQRNLAEAVKVYYLIRDGK